MCVCIKKNYIQPAGPASMSKPRRKVNKRARPIAASFFLFTFHEFPCTCE